MTLVIESAVVLAPLVYSVHKRAEKDAAEKQVASDVYSRYFHRDLWEHAPGRSTSISGNLPIGLDGHAAACIRTIERYQEDRRRWWGALRPGQSGDADTRDRILEELKQWCLTISADTLVAADITTRLEYCRRLLLYPSVFPRSNQTSFLDTIAEVCLHLERLLREAMEARRSGLEQLAQIVRVGREVARLALPVLLFTLPNETVVPARSNGKGPPDPIQVADVLQSAAAAGQPAASSQVPECVVRWDSGVGSVLLALLCSSHAHDMLSGADEPTPSGFDGAASSSSQPPAGNHAEHSAEASSTRSFAPASGSAAPPVGLPAFLAEVRSRWACSEVTADLGLLPMFCGPNHAETRNAFLDLCAHLDRVLFFMQALLPYQRLVNMAGDIALCWLRKSLGHLLQELEKALVQLRQSRLQVMRAAKKELQAQAKSSSQSAEQFRWMQGLRHIDEVRLDRLHQDLSAHCTEVRMASTLAREVELQGAARKGLGDIAASLSSADFQARCSLRLPDRLLADIRQMALTSG